MPSAISVNMLRLRVSSDCQPRTKNGQPAHSTTGVAKANWIQLDSVGSTQLWRADDMPAHRQDEHRQREHEADPEPPRHVDELGVRAGVGRRHPAPAPCRRSGRRRGRLADLRMHRAGVDRAFGHRLGVRAAARDISPDRRRTCVRQPASAEIIGVAAIIGAMLCWSPDRPSCRRPDRSRSRGAGGVAPSMMRDRRMMLGAHGGITSCVYIP